MRLIDADALVEKLKVTKITFGSGTGMIEGGLGIAISTANAMPTITADRPQEWIPCSERLPKVNQNVLLCTNDGKVFVGHRDKPELIWQVTEEDGRKHWVYDPENYTADVDGLPKAEDCAFDKDEYYADGYLSVASMNYDERFVGIIAWMPLPEPYEEREGE